MDEEGKPVTESGTVGESKPATGGPAERSGGKPFERKEGKPFGGGDRRFGGGDRRRFGGGDKRPFEKKRAMDDNVVYVGKKGVMNYVMAALTQLNKGEKEVHVKARGRSISMAVDVVQLLKNRFETNSRIKGIEIGTEEVEADEGGKINVSTIDIVVMK